jgi:hypothetical protein
MPIDYKSPNEVLFLELCKYWWNDISTQSEYLDFASYKWYMLNHP